METKIYSYLQDIKAVAFLDILGFSKLTSNGKDEFETAYWLFVNAIEPYRDAMSRPYNRIARDVPIDPKLLSDRSSFWYKHHVQGSVGFQCTSDSVVSYL